MKSSVKDKIISKEDEIKIKIKKIDVESMIKETIRANLERLDKDKLIDDKEELIKMISEQSMKNYLEYVRNRSNKEGKEYFQKELDSHNEKLKTIIVKMNTEKKEIENKYLDIVKENKLLKDKIFTIENLNKILQQQKSVLEINTENFEIEMNRIAKKQFFLDQLFKRYPGKSEEEILKYLDDLTAGSIQILNDYRNTQEKLKISSSEQKTQEKEFRTTIDKLYLNTENLNKEKNEIKNQYLNKMSNINLTQKTNSELKERNIFLSNTLMHLYNILFKEFGLNRNLIINKKYLDIKDTDYIPNFIYDEEIKNYIELMIKTMHHSTYDILFRETLGYLNMILRIYLPNKMNLRFQPPKAFKEIKDFIDSKMTIIEDNHNVIKSFEKKVEDRDNEISKLKTELKELNKQYNLYKTLVEKEFVKTNKIIYQLKNSGSKKEIRKNSMMNNETNNKTYHNIRAYSSKFKFDSSSKIHPKKLKIKRRAKIFTEEEIKSNEVTTEREQNHIKLLTLNTKKAQRTLTNTEPKKIKKGKNNDKMIRENGNQLRFSDFNKVKLLIDETNRLFLYKSRMNSTIGKVYNEEEINNKKNKVINYGVNFDAEENIKNKIFKQINHLIKNTDY
jgi:hypothetical protein